MIAILILIISIILICIFIPSWYYKGIFITLTEFILSIPVYNIYKYG